MGLLGNIALYGALASIFGAIVAGVLAARSGSAQLMRITERATYAIAAFVTLAVLALQIALITLDFTLQYVGEYTSSTLSVLYRIGSMWAGQGGSLLLWGFIIAITGAWTVYSNKRKSLNLSAWVYVLNAAFVALFIIMVAFFQNPFVKVTKAVADGMGLNPLLQDPLQVIHPLFLYGGYVLFTVPFVVVLGELIAGKVSGAWIEYARVWAILSWVSLTIGMVLGARWAYAELGWGGYWAWDPVENASLIPWLSGTAVVHMGLAHRGNRDRIRMMGVVLLAATFNLCLFGTFLTRSGVIQSVHAFGQSNLGPFLGGAIVVSVLLCGAVLVWRLPQIKFNDERGHNRGWFGQFVLIGLLVAMTLATLWGTLYPLFARAFLNQEVAVSPGFFKAVVTPMGVGILLLLAISPFLPNQRAEKVQREAAIRALMFAVVAGGLYVLGAGLIVSVVVALSVLSVKTILWKARPRLAAAMGAEQDRVRAVAFAGSPYLAHMGLVIMLAAIAINVTGEVKQQVKINVGKTAVAAGFNIRLDDARLNNFADRQSLDAVISILDDNKTPTTAIQTSVAAFANSDQPHTNVGIKSGILRDIYIVIDGWPDDLSNGVTWLRLSVYDNPAVNWVWFGGMLVGIAGILYVLPTRRRRRDGVVVDDEHTTAVQTAVLAVRAGVETTANDRVNTLIRAARDIVGVDADPESVVAFLERTSAPVSSAAGVALSRNALIASGVGVALVAGIGAYVLGHVNGSSVPGISGPLTSASASATSSAAGTEIDDAKATTMMERIKKNPKDVEAYKTLADMYWSVGITRLNNGDSSGATEYLGQSAVFYKKVTTLTPKDANAWVALGEAANLSNDRTTAHDSFLKAIAVDAKNQYAHFDLAVWYLNDSPPQSAKATAEFKIVVAIDPKSEIGTTAAQHVGVSGSSTQTK